MNVLASSLSSAPASSTPTSAPATSDTELTGNSFITLLTAQLQAQDPFDPTDPSTFLNELVQFNSLQQLIDINTQLAQVLGTSSATAPTGSAASATGGTQF